MLELDVVGARRRGYPEAATPGDAVHIGSCCKMVTAALFGTFVAEEQASWEMPVIDLFPDLVDSISGEWRQRTVEELLCCLGGMVANPPRGVLESGHTDTRSLGDQRSELAALAFSQPPRKPGRFVYSNMSYIVMGAAIDRLSGTSFERALSARILEPLAISSAGYGPPPDVWGHTPKFFFGGLAAFKGDSADPNESRSDNPPVLSSAGTLHLSCADWAKLLRLFQDQNDLAVVARPIIERILKLPEGKASRMAMGWAPVNIEGLGFGAQGSNVRWAATALMDEARQRTAFVVCNDGRSRVLSQSVPLAHRLLELGTWSEVP